MDELVLASALRLIRMTGRAVRTDLENLLPDLTAYQIEGAMSRAVETGRVRLLDWGTWTV